MSMADARFIWSEPEGTGRNRYALFRCTFGLAAQPARGQLNLFADTRYRLIVNGKTLGHGPARFFPVKPEADTYDLLPALRRGRNAIAVIVNSTGGVTFHSEPSLGGLIAWGEARDADGNTVPIATGESWRGMESPGHRPDTHYMSFALNPAEFLDARKMPLGWERPDFDDSAWPCAVLHAHADHWGPLVPRSIPLLDESEVRPSRCLGAWAARELPGEDVCSLLVISKNGRSLHTDARVAVMTHIHSPKEQEITFGAWWGRYWLNGEELKRHPATGEKSLRQDFAATFHGGWNTLLMYEQWKQDWWDFYLALPSGAGLEVSAEREIGSPHTFLIGGFWEDALAEEADRMKLPLASPENLPEALGPWRPWPRGQRADTPCRERAWKTFVRIADEMPASVDVSKLAPSAKGATLSLLFDFGGEVLGRPVLDFTAAAGTVVDVAYTERLRPDGVADIHRRYFVDMMERYIARDGRQAWHTFHPRGFRYLELLVRGDPSAGLRAGLGAFELHGVAITRAAYPVEQVGSFECSDPVLTRVWAMGRDTLRACMEDAYLDCPWRERGLYSGDFFVEFFTHLAAFGDTRLFRRCIELFLLSQGENGLIRPCPHGLPPGRHPDYSAIIAQCLWHYWARTGDVAFLRQCLPGLKRLLAGLEALGFEGSDLLDGTHLNPYVDRPDRSPARGTPPRAGVNCGLNCFCQRAFADGARILDLLGETALYAHCFQRAERLAEAIRNEFWDAERRVFLDRPRSLVPETGPSVPANALPLLYGIAECDQVQPALDWLVEALRHNFRVAEPQKHGDTRVSSYFSFYALGALYKYDRAAEAEEFMRTCWGYMLDKGAWTCWEDFLGGDSLCHAWSSAPTFYLSSQVLGVKFPEPGNPDVVRIFGNPGSLEWARGVWPHPRGPIRVAWERRGDKYHVEFQCPDGVKVVTHPGGPA